MKAGTFALRGELAYRIGRNMSRLEDPYFTPEDIFADQTLNNGWPGDREGRAMLADTLLSRLTGRESAHLARFYRLMPLNELGYRGPVLAPRADEQQLSGHNWLVRALLEMYDWRGDERARAMAQAIVEGLYLPLRGKYRLYPVDLSQRVVGGGFGGTQDGLTHQVWITSTDIGCAFMSLDCLSQYYALFRDERVLDLLREMLEVFSGIDLAGLKMQTHATLSALRGALRLYRVTGEEHLLSLALRVFDTYRRQGMSDAYMNYNWFDRPEWTERCAMVDSLMAALELFDVTGETEYLTFAHRAFYTGLGHAQRANGGFGCDTCVGAPQTGDLLAQRTYEAYWCCSMRGAEGLVRMAEHLVMERADGVEFDAYADGLFSFPWGKAEVEAAWPYEGRVSIALTGQWKGRRLKLYAPEDAVLLFDGRPLTGAWAKGFLSAALPQEEGTLSLAFEMPLEYRGALGKFTPRNR
ncbi:MAG: glycoside hydrolase family 127 protein, partial [Clostridia bacterium]|nr:glycoside hydrolase family 127 protein [Clostridia bacterium]